MVDRKPRDQLLPYMDSIPKIERDLDVMVDRKARQIRESNALFGTKIDINPGASDDFVPVVVR